jgi:hypothetical protein
MSTEDRTINPDIERFMAKRMGAKTIEVNRRGSGTLHRSIFQVDETQGPRIFARLGGRRRVELVYAWR